jgi:hypothetical protein
MPPEQPRRAILALVAGHAVGAAGEGDVLVDREVAVDAGRARDVADVVPWRPAHAPCLSGDDADEGAQQRRLAGAVAAHDDRDRPGPHRDADCVESGA